MCLLYEWESAAGTNARHGASASLGSSRDRSRSGAEITLRCRKICRFLELASTTLSIRDLRVSVAESDVYTDVALALELARLAPPHCLIWKCAQYGLFIHNTQFLAIPRHSPLAHLPLASTFILLLASTRRATRGFSFHESWCTFLKALL